MLDPLWFFFLAQAYLKLNDEVRAEKYFQRAFRKREPLNEEGNFRICEFFVEKILPSKRWNFWKKQKMPGTESEKFYFYMRIPAWKSRILRRQKKLSNSVQKKQKFDRALELYGEDFFRF